MLDIAILVGLGLLVAFIVVKLVVGYATAEGSPWDRILASAKDSATILWNYIIAVSGALIIWADQAAAFFNMPEVQKFLTEHLTPARLGTALTVIAVVGIVARLRTLGKA